MVRFVMVRSAELTCGLQGLIGGRRLSKGTLQEIVLGMAVKTGRSVTGRGGARTGA